MTDAELEDIERSVRLDVEVPSDDVLALVAEVRRLRAELELPRETRPCRWRQADPGLAHAWECPSNPANLAVRNEREACAMVADGFAKHSPNTTNDAAEETARDIASAIRSRK